MIFDYTIYDGYLIIKHENNYEVTDECNFNEFYRTYGECIERINELKGI